MIGDLSGGARSAAELIMNIVWAVFAIDYVVRLSLAQPRFHWFITHLIDLDPPTPAIVTAGHLRQSARQESRLNVSR